MAENLTRKLILITGGARSGKSREALTLSQGYKRKAYLATGVATDDEMKQRIAHHQHERGPEWQTLEEPLELAELIESEEASFDVMVIDCLTFWISNLLVQDEDEIAVSMKIGGLLACLRQCQCSVIVVSNEVGTGIVPEKPLSRKFRDLVGYANQELAKVSDRAVFMVAGYAVELK